MSGVPEGASENEGSGRWMRSERKVVVCADVAGGAAGDGGWLMVVVVVEAHEQAGGQAGWMTREGRGRGEGGRVRWRKGTEKEGREGTKGKRLQAGLGSDEGECVTVYRRYSLFSTGEDCLLPARLCLTFAFLVNLPAGRTAGRPRVDTLFIAFPLPSPLLFLPFLHVRIIEREEEREREEGRKGKRERERERERV